MQMSRLKPETRKAYTGKKVSVKHALFTGEAVLKSFHNATLAVIEFASTPVKGFQESNLQQRGKLNTLTVDVKYLHI